MVVGVRCGFEEGVGERALRWFFRSYQTGFGLTFSLGVGSRRVSVSGREVRVGEEVVEATPGVWLMRSGVTSKRGLGNVPCGGSFDPIKPVLV